MADYEDGSGGYEEVIDHPVHPRRVFGRRWGHPISERESREGQRHDSAEEHDKSRGLQRLSL
jgi:hypothetical protein